MFRYRTQIYQSDQNTPDSPKFNGTRATAPFDCELRTVSSRWNAAILRAQMASNQEDHRGRRPDHADGGIARELLRASSLPVYESRNNARVNRLRGSPTA